MKKSLIADLTADQKLELALTLLAELQAAKTPQKPAKKVAKKATKKTAKPTTRTEAIATWKQERGITPAVQAEAKRLKEAHYAEDWNTWTQWRNFKGMTKEERSAANAYQHKMLMKWYLDTAKENVG